MVRNQKDKSIFVDKGMVEQSLVHLFFISRSSHFFNKTDFEQYFVIFNTAIYGVGQGRILQAC